MKTRKTRSNFKSLSLLLGILLYLGTGFMALGQESSLYSARGYWKELSKTTYQSLIGKKVKGKSLSAMENQFIEDYEFYLNRYYSRLSEKEKLRFQQNQIQWDLEHKSGDDTTEEKFEWRIRDRALNALYGAWYGSSLLIIAEPETPAAAGIPLITSGLWLLGPAINPNKYEHITRKTVRLNNTGKLFGLGYGMALATTLFGHDADSDGLSYLKSLAGLSTIGSIALGEVGFRYQQKHDLSFGHIEMLRHYGLVGPWVGVASVLATNSERVNAYGAAALVGGVAGLLIGNSNATKYS